MHRAARGTRAALALGLVLGVLAACGGAGDGNAGAPAPVPTSAEPTAAEPSSAEATQGSPPPPGDGSPSVPSSPDLKAFLADCAKNVDTWHPGQLRYTRRLSIPLHQARTYRAAVDIQPGAQDQPAPDANTGIAGVQVKCGVAARLVPLSADVTVDGGGDWVLREFDQPAVVQWDWSVRAVTTHSTQVRLELRPAIADAEGRHIIPAAEDNSDLTMSGDTDVTVVATGFQRFYQWWSDNWGPLQTIAGALGVAVLAVLTWVGKVRGWFSKGRPAEEPEQPVRPGPPAPRSPQSSARRPAGSGRSRGRPR